MKFIKPINVFHPLTNLNFIWVTKFLSANFYYIFFFPMYFGLFTVCGQLDFRKLRKNIRKWCDK